MGERERKETLPEKNRENKKKMDQRPIASNQSIYSLRRIEKKEPNRPLRRPRSQS